MPLENQHGSVWICITIKNIKDSLDELLKNIKGMYVLASSLIKARFLRCENLGIAFQNHLDIRNMLIPNKCLWEIYKLDMNLIIFSYSLVADITGMLTLIQEATNTYHN